MTILSSMSAPQRAEFQAAVDAAGGDPTVRRQIVNSGFGDTAKMPKLRAGLARVRAGTGNASILYVGDSTTAGFGSGPAGQDYRPTSTPSVISRALAVAGVASDSNAALGRGVAVAAGTAYTGYNPAIVMPTDWTFGFTTLGGESFVGPVGSTNALQYTPPEQTDTLELYFITTTDGGSITVNVNGGATLATASNLGSNSNGITKLVVNATLGANTWNVKGTGRTPIAAMRAYNSAVRRVSVLNGGRSTWTSANLSAGGAYGPITSLPNFGADVIAINIGINDRNSGVDPAVYKTNVQAIISAAKVTSDVYLRVPVPSAYARASQETQDLFNAKLNELAAENSIPIFSFAARYGTQALGFAQGFYIDELHQNQIGNLDAGYAEAAFLLRVAG